MHRSRESRLKQQEQEKQQQEQQSEQEQQEQQEQEQEQQQQYINNYLYNHNNLRRDSLVVRGRRPQYRCGEVVNGGSRGEWIVANVRRRRYQGAVPVVATAATVCIDEVGRGVPKYTHEGNGVATRGECRARGPSCRCAGTGREGTVQSREMWVKGMNIGEFFFFEIPT